MAGSLGGVAEMWVQKPKAAFVFHALILLFLLVLLGVEVLGRKDHVKELVLAIASVFTALLLLLYRRRAMRHGWRGQVELDDGDGGGGDDVPTRAASTVGDAEEATRDRELEAPANDV
jgi:hypothetical protein